MAFLAPTLALWTSSFLSPSCIPFSPAMAYVWRTQAGRREEVWVRAQGPPCPQHHRCGHWQGKRGRPRAESLESPAGP